MLKKNFVAAVFLQMALILGFVGDSPAWAQTGSAVTEGIGTELTRLCNEARRSEGLGELTRLSYLDEAALSHSAEMVELVYFAHESPTLGSISPRDRITLAGGFDPNMGENIYKCEGVDDAKVAAAAMKAWMASPVHRANVMRVEFNSVGFGVVQVGDKVMVTQNFSKQVIEINHLTAVLSGANVEFVLHGTVREGAMDGAVFMGADLQSSFQADADGTFVIRGKVPADSVIKVHQRKSATSFSAALVIPAAAGLTESGTAVSLAR